MRIGFVLIVGVITWLSLPLSLWAGSDGLPSFVQTTREAVIPPYVASFATSDAPVDLDLNTSRVSHAANFAHGKPPRAGFTGDTSSNGSAKRYLPVLYSLLVPGAGEIALGRYYRGAALVALEVAAWSGYAYYRNRGLDGRADFEAFADAHWEHDRWITNHPAVEGLPQSLKTFETVDSIGLTEWQGWPGYHSYAPKEEQKLNYYENIGKYDWFISGWEDWDPILKPRNTSLRTQYRALRKQSNDDLDRADLFVYLSVGTRVFSLVETLIMVHRQKPDGQSGTESRSNYTISTRSTGLASGEVAFVYRF